MRGSLVGFGSQSAVDGLVLEVDVSSVNSLLEDGVSMHREHISWPVCVGADIQSDWLK